MSTSLDHLLPEADESVRCADHARAIAVDPGGTAIRADRVVLVTTPLPWPKPALAHDRLVELAELLRTSPIPTRLLAASPGLGHAEAAEAGLVVVYDRVDGSAVETVFRLDPDRSDDLLALGRALVDDRGRAHEASGPRPVEHHAPARPALLICTQGSHDVCCGSDGVRFLQNVVADPALAGVRVFGVSHTGGHRFAPTAMSLPDGRMWAGLDTAAAAAIVAGDGPVGEVIGRCRGWWGCETGPAQVAERAIFAAVGWDLNARPRSVRVEDQPGSAVAGTRCRVGTEGGDWLVDVRPGRAVPTIACRAPGGMPAKPSTEYEVLSVVDLDERSA